MRTISTVVTLLVLTGCGSDESSDAMAEIAWQLNYRDPTPGSDDTDDYRECDNEPEINPGPPYTDVTNVRITLEDPEGKVRGMDRTYECERGYESPVPIRGLAKQVFSLTIRATAADETLLYEYTQRKLDLSSFETYDLDLHPATGELHVFPTYEGSLDCPANVAKIRYSLYRKVAGIAEEEPALTGISEPACEQGLSSLQSSELFIREIPVQLDGPNDAFDDFEMVLEALDDNDVVSYCGKNENRTVHRGDNSLGGNEDLSAGACQ